MKFISSILIITTVVSCIFTLQSCKKDKEEEPKITNIDAEIFSNATSSGYSFYQNGDLLAGVSPSPHGAFKLRFNSIAAAALDSTGELPSGNTFPSGSIIVKDIYSGSTLTTYAVMKKDPSDAFSGNGWIWAEYKPDGIVLFTTANKGNGCISCHNGTPNRDLTRTFDLH